MISTAFVNLENHRVFESYLINFLTENPHYKPFVKETHKNRFYFSAIPEMRFFKITSSLFNPNDFWGKFGIRSLSKQYENQSYSIVIFGQKHNMSYAPNESETTSFGENSNWRGPVWIPINYILIKSLQTHAHYFGNEIEQKSNELANNLKALFEKNKDGYLPIYTDSAILKYNELSKLPLFFEYFNPETGKGCGASHQTGWTGLIVNI